MYFENTRQNEFQEVTSLTKISSRKYSASCQLARMSETLIDCNFLPLVTLMESKKNAISEEYDIMFTYFTLSVGVKRFIYLL